MKRRAFDILMAVPAVLAVTLAVAGEWLTWGHNFIGNEVRTQLAAQQIFFRPATARPSRPPSSRPCTNTPGSRLTTGAQAEVYADHFIANHLKAIGGGKTYAQLSAEAIAQPANPKLAAQVATVFKGETLRGLLLNAYAFGTMATIAGIAAIAAFIAAAVMLILAGLGLAHARRTSADTEILPGRLAAECARYRPRSAPPITPASRPPTTSSAPRPAPPPPGLPDRQACRTLQPGPSPRRDG